MSPLRLLPVFLFAAAASIGFAAAERLPVGPARDDLVPVILSNEFMVSGEVIGRSDEAFSVLGANAQITTVRVNPDTSILKGAETIRLSDVMIGDRVQVVVMRGGDGSLQAVKVLVRTGYE